MNGRGTQQQARRSPAAFMLWGWAMLLVVLLSAAPGGGQPRTLLLGSAFDPATVSVVLNPKKPRFSSSASAVHKKRLPQTVGGGASHGAVDANLAFVPAAAPLPEVEPPRSDVADLPSRKRVLARAHAPRAPPLA